MQLIFYTLLNRYILRKISLTIVGFFFQYIAEKFFYIRRIFIKFASK